MNFKYKPGMRALKTILSVFFTIVISKLLGRQEIIFALIATCIAMGTTVSDSFIDAKNRIIGTIFGAIVGLIFFKIQPGSSVYIALGVCIIIYLCNVFKIDKTISMSCVVFFSVVLKDVAVQNPFNYAIDRIVDTSLGVLIAIIINITVFPPNYMKRVIKEKKYLQQLLCNIMDNIIDENYSVKDIDDLEKSITDLKDYVFLIKDDINIYKRRYKSDIHDEMYLYKNLYENIKDIIKVRYEINEKSDMEHIDDVEIKNLNIVLDYHIDKAKLDYNILKKDYIK